jgi:transposase
MHEQGTTAPRLVHRDLPGTEQEAKERLLRYCHRDRLGCPRCGAAKHYALADGRRRCAACGYTFHDLTGRWINRGRLSCKSWLRLVDGFVREESLVDVARAIGATYNTVYNAYVTVRLAIAAQDPDLREHLPLWLQGRGEGRGAGSFVFGQMQASEIRFRILPRLTVQDLLILPLDRFRWQNIIMTGPYQEFESLTFCCRKEYWKYCGLDAAADLPAKKIVHPFWRYFCSSLRNRQGITPKRYPLYLKEMEFRFNRRGEDLFPLLLGFLCCRISSQFPSGN